MIENTKAERCRIEEGTGQAIQLFVACAIAGAAFRRQPMLKVLVRPHSLITSVFGISVSHSTKEVRAGRSKMIEILKTAAASRRNNFMQ